MDDEDDGDHKLYAYFDTAWSKWYAQSTRVEGEISMRGNEGVCMGGWGRCQDGFVALISAPQVPFCSSRGGDGDGVGNSVI